MGLTACSTTTPETGVPTATTGAGPTTATTEPSVAAEPSVTSEPFVTTEAASTSAPTGGPDPGPVAGALALAPEGASYLTVTDWARIKQRLGAGDLTGESIQTDRIEFWRGVAGSTVLLTEGALRPENSRLGLRYGVTQDDVLWEVRWSQRATYDSATDDPGTGDDAGGLALRLRDDLDLAGVERAVADGVPGVEGSHLLVDQHLLLREAGEAGTTLLADPGLSAALAPDAETQVVVPGCLSWPAALGVDATIEDQELAAANVPVEDLLDPDAWRMSFTGRAAQVAVIYPEGTSMQAARDDAEIRLTLTEEWPTTESVGWGDAFGLPPGLTGDGYTVTQTASRVMASADYRVLNPTAAATLALAGLVPWAVCSEIDWLAEPTGL